MTDEVPQDLHSKILLPIVLLRGMDLGRGIYTVAGIKPDLFLVQRVIQLVVGQVDLERRGLAA